MENTGSALWLGQLTDAIGRRIKLIAVKPAAVEPLDLAAFPSGMYWIVSEKGRARSIVKQ